MEFTNNEIECYENYETTKELKKRIETALIDELNLLNTTLNKKFQTPEQQYNYLSVNYSYMKIKDYFFMNRLILHNIDRALRNYRTTHIKEQIEEKNWWFSILGIFNNILKKTNEIIRKNDINYILSYEQENYINNEIPRKTGESIKEIMEKTKLYRMEYLK
jgi:hypothetical protein